VGCAPFKPLVIAVTGFGRQAGHLLKSVDRAELTAVLREHAWKLADQEA
jgi:hypothetical protein